MAKRRSSSSQQIPSISNRFDKGMNTDIRDYHLDDMSWTHARNAINNSHIGDLGDLGNEPSNEFCAGAPYKIIGAIHMEAGKWWIFSGNDATGSEIGEFDEDNCTYERIVNDPCLGFRSTHPISGSSRPTWDCSNRAYWQDNLNPDRTLDRADVPWFQTCTEDPDGCVYCVDTDVLDCDKIRLEVFMTPPCATIVRGPAGGNIKNGSYYVHVAYVLNGQKVSDYFPMSNVIALFEHDQVNASLDVTIEGLDTNNFDQYQLVLVRQVDNKLAANIIGIYSTNNNNITIDVIDPTSEGISVNDLLITNPVADRSEGIFNVGKYLFRTGITGKFDFNYQPLANQIRTKWQVVEYPEDYYKNGGTNVGHMRDEVYSYYVRFRYLTGDYTPSYHIPGRAAKLYEIPIASPGPAIQMLENENYLVVEDNNIEQQQGLVSKVFEMFNTANGSGVSITLPDGGQVVAEGQMGYWESDEYYDDKNPEIWNSNIPTEPELDLCGKRIRHHRFPENTLYEGTGLGNTITNHYVDNQKKIRVMAVSFENIQPPVDNSGNLIPNIVGYEILRGSRNGNRTVLYKGIINNMREYEIAEQLNTQRQGLYPNYPYNGLTPDLFTSLENTSWEPLTGDPGLGTVTNPNQYRNYRPNPNYSQKHFTFHSPDTSYYKPFLGQKELKIYGAAFGDAESQYVEVEDHPKHVFITDVSFIVGLLIGIGYAITQQVGKKTRVQQQPSWYRYGFQKGGLLDIGGASPVYSNTSVSARASSLAGGTGAASGGDAAINAANTLNNNLTNFVDSLFGLNTSETALNIAQNSNHALNSPSSSGVTSGGAQLIQEDKSQIPVYIAAVQSVSMFITNVTEAAELTMNIIREASKARNFALQYQSHCGYEKFGSPYNANRRRIINEAVYLGQQLQDYLTDFRINNYLRSKTVAFDTTIDVANLGGVLSDSTMTDIRVSDLGDENAKFSRQASSHYVAFKTRLRNQYGSVHSVQQLPASHCVIPISETTTGTIFGGDTYIGRHQEKNTFYHFYNWLTDQKDRTEFNYHLYDTVQHTAFWMDTEPFDLMEFVNSLSTGLDAALNSGGAAVSTFFDALVTPSDKHSLDRKYGLGSQSGVFTVKNSWIYLFHSSVRDFFVESDINVDMRDWDDIDIKKQHWAVNSNLTSMFRAKNIRAGNYWLIDRSMSVDYLPFSKVSWGFMQDLQYDPLKAETCYTYYPRRLLYSLPQQTMLKKDNWSSFLGNNFQDFSGNVTAIKAVRNTGIMLLFDNQAPGMYPGVDELQLKSGTSLTVGDGGLFAREMQSVSNTDTELEYGSCQSRRSVLNTPAGLFYISQEQGKIFTVGKGLEEITLTNNQYWFNQYLPYQLILDFPEFDLLDNTIAGIGCQAVYDNQWGIVYFCKKDFRAKPEYLPLMEYIGNGEFLVDKITRVKTGDPRYFNDASWTVSYDPKNKQEISFHDWHPNLAMSSKNTFLTVNNDGIWRHNERCDSYCNFYGDDYPFEIEFQIDALPAVTTVRSVEYFMQVFKFDENCRDRFHVLDFNFDEAVVYNSEQVSGLLKMTAVPFNNVVALKEYPIVGLNEINIVYSKVEQKYRFNQFWDTTKDRGEFSPTVTETIWITEPNGYVKNLNPINLNYAKSTLQHKKIRHNNNRVLLRRTVSGNKKMLMIMNNTKIQNSPR
tara:strand:+ start:115 stop:5103 length:4989 start_codon:yes stop_codon:yes gene_type:complete